jgi:hypothetical protein
MQQFLVPQFIDVENKILGPITVRQFIIMIVVIGMIFVYYKSLDFSAFLFFTIITLVIGAAFAFLKINGTLFHFFLLNVLQTSLRPSLRIWEKEIKQSKEIEREQAIDIVKPVQVVNKSHKKVTSSRLAELSLIVNTGGYYKGEDY